LIALTLKSYEDPIAKLVKSLEVVVEVKVLIQVGLDESL